MSEFKTKNQEQNKASSQSKSANDTSSQETMGYKDSRASNENLIKLQAASEAPTNRGLLGGIKSKADSFTSGSGVAQLQAKSNASKAPNDSEVIQRVLDLRHVGKMLEEHKLSFGLNKTPAEYLKPKIYEPLQNVQIDPKIENKDDSRKVLQSDKEASIAALKRGQTATQGNESWNSKQGYDVALAEVKHNESSTSFTSMEGSAFDTYQGVNADGENFVTEGRISGKGPSIVAEHSADKKSLEFQTGKVEASLSNTETSHKKKLYTTSAVEAGFEGPSVGYSKEEGAYSSLGGGSFKFGRSWSHNDSKDPDKPNLNPMLDFSLGWEKGSLNASGGINPENIGNAIQDINPEGVKEVSNYVSNPIPGLVGGHDIYSDNTTTAETHLEMQPPTPKPSPTETPTPKQSPSPTPSPGLATLANNPTANGSLRGILGRGIAALGLQPTIPSNSIWKSRLSKNPVMSGLLNRSKAPTNSIKSPDWNALNKKMGR